MRPVAAPSLRRPGSGQPTPVGRLMVGTAAVLGLGLGGALSPTPAAAEDIRADEARLGWLDKITARVGESRVRVGEPLGLGSLAITVETCIRRVPPDDPESAALLLIRDSGAAAGTSTRDEDPADDASDPAPAGEAGSRTIFSGWMFASSPALSAMDHGVYDVWVLECVIPADRAGGAATPAPSDVAPDSMPDLPDGSDPDQPPLD